MKRYWTVAIFVVAGLVLTGAMVNPVYHSSVYIGGGPTDADGGAQIENNGDAEFSGTLEAGTLNADALTAEGELTITGDMDLTGKLDIKGPLYVGVNGSGGTAGSITFRDGANPGATETLTFTKWNSLNDTVGLPIGNGVGVYSALDPTDGNVPVGNGTTYVPENGATFRTSIGLGTSDAPTFGDMTATGTVQGEQVTSTDDATVWDCLTVGRVDVTSDDGVTLESEGSAKPSLKMYVDSAGTPIFDLRDDAGIGTMAMLQLVNSNVGGLGGSLGLWSQGDVWLGKNGSTGGEPCAGSITLMEGLSTGGGTESLTYAKWNSLNDVSGIVKCSGSGSFSAGSKSDLGLGNVENTALSTWAGTVNVVTTGTVTTGVWNAGAVTSSGKITARQSDYPTGSFTRTSAFTNLMYGCARVVHETSGDMADSFGSGIVFEATDSGVSNAILGQIGAVRQGADTEGKLVFRCGTNGADEHMTLDKDGNLYVVNNCSAASFTDRTPGYSGDALAELASIKNDANGNINHSTLPSAAQKKIKVQRNTGQVNADGNPITETVEEPGRDLGAMVSFLTAVCQKQQEQIEDLANRVEKLEKKATKQ